MTAQAKKRTRRLWTKDEDEFLRRRYPHESTDSIAAAIARHTARRIPLAVDLWSTAEIADYLKCTERYVLDNFAARPDFPPAVRLPGKGARRGHPRYKAADVIKWAESWTTKQGS